MDELVSQQVSQALASADYQQTVGNVTEAIESCTRGIIEVSGLDHNQSKLFGYWCSSTHIAQEKKTFSPPLTAISSTSSGKSNAIQVAEHYCCKPELVNAKKETYPTVRDKVILALNSGTTKTIIVEEADRCKHSEELEEFIFSSYHRTTAEGSVKRLTPGSQRAVFKDCGYNIFVPFIVHRRYHYFDVANENRGVEIRFEPKAGKFPKARCIQMEHTGKMRFADDLTLPQSTQPDGVEGRVWDNWELVMKIALALGDANWIQWAIERMKKDSLKLRDGRESEPQTAIFLSTIAASKRNVNGRFQAISISQIKDKLWSEFSMKLTCHNIHTELSDLGIRTKRPHGALHAYIDDDRVRKVAEKLGLDAEELFEEKPSSSAVIPAM